MAPLQAVVMSG